MKNGEQPLVACLEKGKKLLFGQDREHTCRGEEIHQQQGT
jgi:hypothetical protein